MENLKAYLTGRSGRREFWIWMVATLAIMVVGTLLYPNKLLWSALSFLPWVVFASRRLRDFGASPWWVVFPVASGFVIGFVVGFLNAATPSTPVIAAQVQALAIGLVNWVFIIYVGSRGSRPSPATVEIVG